MRVKFYHKTKFQNSFNAARCEQNSKCLQNKFEKAKSNLPHYFTKNSFHLLFLCEICATITLTFGSDLASTGVEWLRWHTALDKALKVRQNLNANNAKFAPAYAKIA